MSYIQCEMGVADPKSYQNLLDLKFKILNIYLRQKDALLFSQEKHRLTLLKENRDTVALILYEISLCYEKLGNYYDAVVYQRALADLYPAIKQFDRNKFLQVTPMTESDSKSEATTVVSLKIIDDKNVNALLKYALAIYKKVDATIVELQQAAKCFEAVLLHQQQTAAESPGKTPHEIYKFINNIESAHWNLGSMLLKYANALASQKGNCVEESKAAYVKAEYHLKQAQSMEERISVYEKRSVDEKFGKRVSECQAACRQLDSKQAQQLR